jgi:hypothetical protein
MDEMLGEIVQQKGTVRFGFQVTIKDYFEEMKAKGYYILAGFSEKGDYALYVATDKFREFARRYPNCIEDGLDPILYDGVVHFCIMYKAIEKELRPSNG